MNHETTATPTSALDPVYGMTVDPAKAVGSSSYKGEMYYFCSRGCESKFDAAPEQYTGGSHSDRTERASCCSTGHSQH